MSLLRGGRMPDGGLVATYTDTLLRGAIDAIDEAFVLFDPDDRLVFCNDKYRRLYGTFADWIVPGM